MVSRYLIKQTKIQVEQTDWRKHWLLLLLNTPFPAIFILDTFWQKKHI